MKKDVYILLDPTELGQFSYGKRLPISFIYKPIYVGIGKSLNRYKNHLYQARTNKGSNLYKNRVISAILNEGLEPVLLVLFKDLESDVAGFIEEYLIESFKRKCNGGTLTNLTRGGEGLQDPSPETREKIRKSALNQSEEKRKSISESHKGKIISEETRQKLREINTGKKQSEETIRKRMESMDKIRTDELHWKMGPSQRGKERPKEHSDKIRAAKNTEESRQKASESMKAYWRKRKQQERQSAAKHLI